jgi:hypothetical protein
MKIRPVETALIHADRQTDGHDGRNMRLWKLAETLKPCYTFQLLRNIISNT